MMKVQEKTPAEPELTFPAVYISRDTGRMVMFVTEQKGMVIGVRADDTTWIGLTLDSWVPCSDTTTWRKFIGTLEFS